MNKCDAKIKSSDSVVLYNKGCECEWCVFHQSPLSMIAWNIKKENERLRAENERLIRVIKLTTIAEKD